MPPTTESRALKKYWLSGEFALPAMSCCYSKLYGWTENCGKYENALKIVLSTICFKKARVFEEESIPPNIKIIFYNGQNVSKSVSYDLERIVELLDNDRFNPNKITVFYVHGYIQTIYCPKTAEVLQAYLNQNKKYNIIQIAWTKYAFGDYKTEAVASVPILGKVIAKYLDRLIANGLPRDNIHLVGHSCGAQIAAAIGRNLIEKVPLLVGLDIAGPNFGRTDPHFCKDDAKYTIALHTDSGFYGTTLRDAHLDLNINGGTRYQPNSSYFTIPMTLTDADLISHQICLKIWADIIENPGNFIATDYNKKAWFSRRRPESRNTISISDKIRGFEGIYYLWTNDTAPYGKGQLGV